MNHQLMGLILFPLSSQCTEKISGVSYAVCYLRGQLPGSDLCGGRENDSLAFCFFCLPDMVVYSITPHLKLLVWPGDLLCLNTCEWK